MTFCEKIFHSELANFILYYRKLNLKSNSDSQKEELFKRRKKEMLHFGIQI
jgi:hypothetical protein